MNEPEKEEEKSVMEALAGRAAKERALQEAFKTFCETRLPDLLAGRQFGDLPLDERRQLSFAFWNGAQEGIAIWISSTEDKQDDKAVAGLTREIFGEMGD